MSITSYLIVLAIAFIINPIVGIAWLILGLVIPAED